MIRFYFAAILMDATGFPIQTVCAYLNARNDYWYKDSVKEQYYVPYVTERAQIKRTQMKKLERAFTKMFRHGKYSLAEEYTIMNNALHAMEEQEGFIEANKELYQDAVNTLGTLRNLILYECLTTMHDQCADLIQNNTIQEEQQENAIHRYMAANHYDAA